MNCSNCYENITYELTAIHIEYLKLFIDDLEVLEKYKTFEDIYESETSDYLSKCITEKMINAPEQLLSALSSNEQPTFRKLCDHCGKESKEYFFNHKLYRIYSELDRNLNDFIYLNIAQRTGLNYQQIYELHEFDNGDTCGYWAGIKTLEKIDPKLAEKVKISDKIKIQFHYFGERGGDGDNGLIFFIFGFVASSIVPNMIYDISKASILKLITLLKNRLKRKTYINEVEQKVNDNYPDLYDHHAIESILKYLPKKQRKKIIRKIINDQLILKESILKRKKRT